MGVAAHAEGLAASVVPPLGSRHELVRSFDPPAFSPLLAWRLAPATRARLRGRTDAR